MTSRSLDQIRCEKCQKLLFRGIVGLGFIEVKCGRCGHVNIMNSYDAMLHSTPGAYVFVYESDGKLIANSKTAEEILGYSAGELGAMTIHDIDSALQQVTPAPISRKMTLKEWEHAHKSLPPTTMHKTKGGEEQPKFARYYPIGTHTGVYTVGIFYPRPI